MIQTPDPDSFLLKWRGDALAVELRLDAPRKGHAALRTNIGRARVRRREIIAATERGETPLARAWTDIPLPEVEPGVYRAEIVLDEVGVFSGKACFFPEGSEVPEWPEGRNFHIKVESAETRRANSIYTVFPRQFGSFREVVRRLPLIMDKMGFRLIQTLPPFPVPTTYAVMGEYGCPFAATDFLSVDPAMAEFDEYATPLDQFKELIGAVHARQGLFLVDLPANHTGWASTLQTHHPEWFHRERNGRFVSPGAWGVVWADLVELDYANAELRAYMADVFLFWCRLGVDGFRCDAGYMIPAETWEYIVAKVREEYPDTIFMLEGLGGKLEVTDRLLKESNLDWAYSEIFQTYDRGQFEWYLPGAIDRAEKYGTLVHFAETHDNDRLAKGGETYARLRVQLAALLSWQGAWGIANGVEWYCREKIDVHGKNDLNWGAANNMVELIAKLNHILATHPSYAGATHLEVVTRGDGNTLAVVRDGLLVLANLDCGNAATVDWDRSKTSGVSALDLLTELACDIAAPVRLEPGEVKCLQFRATGAQPGTCGGGDAGATEALFHIVYPRDAKRFVCVPENQAVEMTAPCEFRLRLIDPQTGRTVRVTRSANRRAVFDAPHYKGDGTRCRELFFDVTLYRDGRPVRSRSQFLVPPRSDLAAMKTELPGEEVRHHPDWRTMLSNGAGAASQVRVAWGEIRSQYDALLAANPHPTCPSDRVNLWTRTRAWLQREGYAREFNSLCLASFAADPAGRFARWNFRMPCGMGLETAFVFELALTPGANAATLKVVRTAAAGQEAKGRVRLVFRPDVEWRSFHATTKAYAGLEELFPAKCGPIPCGARRAGNVCDASSSNSAGRAGNVCGAPSRHDEGFLFHPYDGTFELTVENGVYHHEPQWSYNVGHPEEAERGQDGAGDLFSPGWISADLDVGESVTLTGRLDSPDQPLSDVRCPLPASSVPSVGFADALRQAMSLFIVRRDDLKTVIAGYPWFLDWGRDTFIFMRGMIAAGMYEDSLKILQAFAAFEENGTLPNIIYGKTAGNRDTTDAQLWFVRCVQELEVEGSALKVEGDRLQVEGSGVQGRPSTFNLQPSTFNLQLSTLKKTCESIVDNYIKGTPNGIHMDEASGLVWSPSHFTWMDTNYPACTPRVGYPVEIQALWISALRFLGRTELADKALASVVKYFKIPDNPTNRPIDQSEQSNNRPIDQSTNPTNRPIDQSTNPNNRTIEQSNNRTILQGYRDCLAAPHGEPAADAVPEDTVRPNQLFLVSLGILDDRSILRATEELLVPGGVRSLNAEHPLYRGVYAGDEDTCRKPAYHNGTVWAWPFPLYAEALAATGACSNEVALQLLASAVENLNAGCLCHVSEIADGDAPHAQKGCFAQAWSVSELLRVWLKLGGR